MKILALTTILAVALLASLAVSTQAASPSLPVVSQAGLLKSGQKLKPTAKRSYIARVLLSTRAYARPNSKSRVLGSVSNFSSWARQQQQLLILNSARTNGALWLRVRLGQRPNNSAVWIPANRSIVLANPWRISISRSQRKVRIIYSGRVLRRVLVVVGANGTPTPAGNFAVYEKGRYGDARGFLGPFALHLTAHSNVLDNFGGGRGRVALHGRGGSSLNDPLGSAASHGCVRMNNRQISWLHKRIPVGTLVTIR